MELLKWWSEFRKDKAVKTDWLHRIWNNQEIRINNIPVFYKRYFNYGVQTVGDLRFDLNNIDSYELIAKHIQKTNFLEWTTLCHSVPLDLRTAYHNPDHTALYPSFKIDFGLFDITNKKSKVAIEPYVNAFRFKILNSILYTNSKLYQKSVTLQMIFVLSANA